MDYLDVKDLVLRRLYQAIADNVVSSIYAVVKNKSTAIMLVLSDTANNENYNLSRSFVTMFEDIPELTITTYNSYNYYHRFNHLLIYSKT